MGLGLEVDLPLGVAAVLVFVHLDALGYVWDEVLVVDVPIKQVVGSFLVVVATIGILADEAASVVVEVGMCPDYVLSQVVAGINAGCGIAGGPSTEANENLLHPTCLQVTSLSVLAHLSGMFKKASGSGIRVNIFPNVLHIALYFDGFYEWLTVSVERGLFAGIKIEGVGNATLNAFGNAAPQGVGISVTGVVVELMTPPL